ncbi:glucosyl-3-phosphoglycerate synthase [Corynebacterium gerontici]|uniref:Glucosyl-3-phosphoglycerate synthase n=1 Tax=Corynebacterium gerontici TaxID=2079234 RepID=A0A3G6J2F5_9CORY|nr:glucosyl-3-phosphoglycerate synthase [Corynebacterium gerontici]AZA11158.1 Glucosyl-3-phosphoglycerate synthase [Corynebacterium gerontici]
MISVVIPALNEEATVAHVVQVARRHADEVLVIDADSRDATAQVASDAGATVLNWRDIMTTPPLPGKGESLWRGVHAAQGEVVVFLDADLQRINPDIVELLAAPFEDPSIHLVKAAYERPMTDGSEGGRVTHLTARPLLQLLFPELAHIRQPLGGEYAIRRSTAEQVPFVAGYGVEVGLLIDVARRYGPRALLEVEAGVRTHRNRPLHELSSMAQEVAATILQRAGQRGIEVTQRPALKG